MLFAMQQRILANQLAMFCASAATGFPAPSSTVGVSTKAIANEAVYFIEQPNGIETAVAIREVKTQDAAPYPTQDVYLT